MGLDNPGIVGGIRDAGLFEESSCVVIEDPSHVVQGASAVDDVHATASPGSVRLPVS